MGYSDAWKKIQDDVLDFISTSGASVIFRGHSSETFKLIPSLFRLPLETLGAILQYEHDSYRLFQSLGYMHHKQSDWDLLYTMQHHGMKTRLLDWSESFCVALYFAFKNWNWHKESAHVWMLDAERLNEITLGFKAISTIGKYPYEQILMGSSEETEQKVPPFALFPVRSNMRIIAQQGLFTFHTYIPLEDWQDGLLVRERVLQRVDLDTTVYHDVNNYLRQNGINEFSLFPDLDTLAKHVDKRVRGM